jgi:hypothetical protein
MKNRTVRTLTLIVLAAALSPLCVAQSSFTGDLHRMDNSEHAGWAHLSFDSELGSNRHEQHLTMTLELFGFSFGLTATWYR